MIQNKNFQLFLKKQLKSLGRFLGSIQLAVIIIIGMAIIASVGTFIEAKYDAMAAKKLVYDSFWMYLIFTLLTINLMAVLVNRWPWKKNHLPFIFAHVGIIFLIIGSVLTKKYGLDGSLRISVGGENRFVLVDDTEMNIYASFNGDNYTKIFNEEVDFFKKSPREEPLKIPVQDAEVQVIDYEKYVIPRKDIVEVKQGKFGPGLRFQFENSKMNINLVEWLIQKNPSEPVSQSFGPAQIHLGPMPVAGHGRNEIYFLPRVDSKESFNRLDYVVFHKDSNQPFKKGTLKEGDVFEPGWMGFKIRILRYLPQAKEQWDIKPLEKPTPLTTSAVKIRFLNEEHWLLLNDVIKFFTPNAAYMVSYSNKRVDLGFSVKLKKFEVEHYQGTMRPASYKSTVEIPELGVREISMNEPLYYKGLKLFQASFSEDDNGQPNASVLSVNFDPGRSLKYWGSLIMTLGIIMLFYFKKKLFSNRGVN